ncbi:MAG: nuclear transport factor 2 family protein [Lachnospiraceae bacterium]|nr:nuclear transport factor 2 family protein [Lachnospiraceae bacterium]
MKRVNELVTPVGVFQVSDGEKTIPFDIRPNHFLDRPWKVRDDTDIAVGTIDTDSKYSIYVPLLDLEIGREYTISFSAGEWKKLGDMDGGYCYNTVIKDWVIGIGADDPDGNRSLFYSVYPLAENNGYRFSIIDKGRANAHFDVAWVKIGQHRPKDYEDAVYSWLYPQVWITDMKKHWGESFRVLEEGMWKAACGRDAEAFLELVCEDAVMVCGGRRLSGDEYSEIIKDFGCKAYEIEHFEVVCQTEESIQTHYVISLEVCRDKDKDLEGKFHVTTTWRKNNGRWKAVFNMDQRIM